MHNLGMDFTKNPSDHTDSGDEQVQQINSYLVEHKRWKKKTVQARWLIGVLTVICCILIVILIVTYESGGRKTNSSDCSFKKAQKTTSDSVVKFIHLSDIHYDPFYNKTIPGSSFCRRQLSNNTAKYVAQYGRIGCDSPALLFENSLDAMKNLSQGEEVKFILLTGRSGFLMVMKNRGDQEWGGGVLN